MVLGSFPFGNGHFVRLTPVTVLLQCFSFNLESILLLICGFYIILTLPPYIFSRLIINAKLSVCNSSKSAFMFHGFVHEEFLLFWIHTSLWLSCLGRAMIFFWLNPDKHLHSRSLRKESIVLCVLVCVFVLIVCFSGCHRLVFNCVISWSCSCFMWFVWHL